MNDHGPHDDDRDLEGWTCVLLLLLMVLVFATGLGAAALVRHLATAGEGW